MLDQARILSEFPDIKLSYENITHKKVYNSDLVIACPEGKKCFAWFTHYEEAPACLIIEMCGDARNVYVKPCCFNSDLAYGTIVYGTMLLNNQFFALEDIFRYKGTDVSRKNWGDKMTLFHAMLKNDMTQMSYNKSFVVFGMPPFAKSFDEVVAQIRTIRGYKIATIQYRLYNRSNNYLVSNPPYPPLGKVEPNRLHPPFQKAEPNRQNRLPVGPSLIHEVITGNLAPPFPKVDKVGNLAVFAVKPDVQNDIYKLHLEGGRYHNVALVPDFKTSVLLNKLFRNIKENANLDALEESDDESEFEDDRDDRFVFLDKVFNMVCAYNRKFKKWSPVRLADASAKLVTSQELVVLEQSYINKYKNKY